MLAWVETSRRRIAALATGRRWKNATATREDYPPNDSCRKSPLESLLHSSPLSDARSTMPKESLQLHGTFLQHKNQQTALAPSLLPHLNPPTNSQCTRPSLAFSSKFLDPSLQHLSYQKSQHPQSKHQHRLQPSLLSYLPISLCPRVFTAPTNGSPSRSYFAWPRTHKSQAPTAQKFSVGDDCSSMYLYYFSKRSTHPCIIIFRVHSPLTERPDTATLKPSTSSRSSSRTLPDTE